MKLYDASRPLYLETDVSGVGLGKWLLQVRERMNSGHDEVSANVTPLPMACTSKSLSDAEWWYSNIEWEALEILQGLQKFHHYCFAREVCVIMDHIPLVVIISKDVAMLSQCLQCILLHIYQYSVCILYKPAPDLYIVDWLSKNNCMENKDWEITGMNINVHTFSTALDILTCTYIGDKQAATR